MGTFIDVWQFFTGHTDLNLIRRLFLPIFRTDLPQELDLHQSSPVRVHRGRQRGSEQRADHRRMPKSVPSGQRLQATNASHYSRCN